MTDTSRKLEVRHTLPNNPGDTAEKMVKLLLRQVYLLVVDFYDNQRKKEQEAKANEESLRKAVVAMPAPTDKEDTM